MKRSVRIGTRGSKLALYQAYKVKEELGIKFHGIEFEVVIIKTKGDIILDVPLSKIGDKGLFTKELETALFNHEIDIAVHSLKDLPTVFPEGAMLGAVLKRGEVRDALVSLNGRKLSDLNADDVIATSSLRRKAQLWRINKDFKITEIRGNVNTRIRKMQEGQCTAMVMAAAGLQRLEMNEYISEVISLETMIPACSQGAIAIEIRSNDKETARILEEINDSETMITTTAERAFLRTLEGGCQIPVGSYSVIKGDKFSITGFIASIDGSVFLQDTMEGFSKDATDIAIDLAAKLYNNGGKEILEEIRKIDLSVNSDLPLKGKVIISTRPVDTDDKLPELISRAGGSLISLPMIEIRQSILSESEKKVLINPDKFNWLFFTSKNGVVSFFKHLIDLKGNTVLPGNTKIAVIGKKTAEELEYYGYSADFISNGNTSADMLSQFKKDVINPEKVLLLLGNLADNVLLEGLKEISGVERVNVYDTIKPLNIDQKIIKNIKEGSYDLVLFTSPSAIENFCSLFSADELNRIKSASIGPTTSEAMIKAGCRPLITSDKSTAEGLFESIKSYYKQYK